MCIMYFIYIHTYMMFACMTTLQTACMCMAACMYMCVCVCGGDRFAGTQSSEMSLVCCPSGLSKSFGQAGSGKVLEGEGLAGHLWAVWDHCAFDALCLCQTSWKDIDEAEEPPKDSQARGLLALIPQGLLWEGGALRISGV